MGRVFHNIARVEPFLIDSETIFGSEIVIGHPELCSPRDLGDLHFPCYQSALNMYTDSLRNSTTVWRATETTCTRVRACLRACCGGICGAWLGMVETWTRGWVQDNGHILACVQLLHVLTSHFWRTNIVIVIFGDLELLLVIKVRVEDLASLVYQSECSKFWRTL